MEKPKEISVLAGMTAKLVITGYRTTSPEEVLVPVGAVVADAEAKPFVWLVDEESMTVSKQSVVAGAITGDRIAVAEGLEGGEAIAMSGVHLLTDGMEVTELQESDLTRK
jgi:multidrug efflux pump subunit AcrA (membrane-fusion protein)